MGRRSARGGHRTVRDTSRSAHSGHPPRRPRSPSTTVPSKLSPGIALAYIYQVRVEFEKEPHVYTRFLELLRDFKNGRMNAADVTQGLASLFRGHKDLLIGFNTFLPKGYGIQVSEDGEGVLQTYFPMDAERKEQDETVLTCACCGAVKKM